MVMSILVLWFLLGCAAVGGFSCYGIYVFVFAPAAPPTLASVPVLNRLAVGRAAGRRRGAAGPQQSSAATTATPVPTEIVVKIVREVVHVTPDGNAYAGSRGTLQREDVALEGDDAAALEETIAEAATRAVQKAVAESAGSGAPEGEPLIQPPEDTNAEL